MKRIITAIILLNSLIFAQLVPGDLIITEYMPDPVALPDSDGEYFEIYNNTDTNIDINGWTLKDDGTNIETIINGGPLSVPSGGVIILARSPIATLPYVPDYVWNSFTLGNTDDEIVLVHPTDGEIARCNYSDGDNFGSGIANELIDIVFGYDGLVIGADMGPDFQPATALLQSGDKGSPGVLGGTLPVELTTFAANVFENDVNLNWETATEVNNYGFEIERKIVTQIASNLSNTWGKIGFVNGHGNSNSTKNYSFQDNSISLSGGYSYRLKQIDIDGKYEYSQIVEVEIGIPTEFEVAQNFPNPFNPTTSISFSLPEKANVEVVIYSMLGEIVHTLVNSEMEAGKYRYDFNASNLSSGTYIYRVSTGNNVEVRKMILLK
jgi:Lamin Tail Domain/Secretion system C-terminal sorting domain